MKFFNSQKSHFIYMIGDDGAILLHLEKGKVERRLFAASPDNKYTKIFLELLRKHPDAPIYVFIDIMDQSYVRHSLPPVSSLGVGKLVQRRLDRDFTKEDIKGYISLGRETEGRKDWNFLLISLPYNESIKAWLELVYDEPNYFAGTYLVPVESEHIIKMLHSSYKKINESAPTANLVNNKLISNEPIISTNHDHNNSRSEDKNDDLIPIKKEQSINSKKTKKKQKQSDGWQILVSHNKVGGFRQVVTKDGKLVFTRLAQVIDSNSPEVIAGSVEQEIQSTIEYIKRLSYSHDLPLDIYVIVAPQIKEFVSGASLGKNVFLHRMTPFQASEILGIQNSILSADLYGDIVLATSFANNKKKRLKLNPQYPKKLESIYLAKKITRYAGVAAAIAISIATLFSSFIWYGNHVEEGDAEKKLKKIRSELTELEDASKKLPIDATIVTDLLHLNNSLSKPYDAPLDFIKRITALTSDIILVKKISWNKSTAIEISSDKKPPVSIQLSIDVTYKTGDWAYFVKYMDDYFAKLDSSFPDFDISHDGLTGKIKPTNDMQINFEDIENNRNNGHNLGEVFSILIEFNSKNKEEDHSLFINPYNKKGVIL